MAPSPFPSRPVAPSRALARQCSCSVRRKKRQSLQFHSLLTIDGSSRCPHPQVSQNHTPQESNQYRPSSLVRTPKCHRLRKRVELPPDLENPVYSSRAMRHVQYGVVTLAHDQTGGYGGTVCLPRLEGVDHRFGILRWKERYRASLGLNVGAGRGWRLVRRG